MPSLLSLTADQPTRTLAAGEALVTQGDPGGDLFILETGSLGVERDGVGIATLEFPGTLVGEMSVLLGIRSSATVRAIKPGRVRVIRDARRFLEQDPVLCFRVAALLAGRLDATSGLLVEMRREHKGPAEQGLLGRIVAALNTPAREEVHRHDLFGTAGGP